MKNILIGLSTIFFVLSCTQSKNNSNNPNNAQKLDQSVEANVIRNLANNIIFQTYLGLSNSTQQLHDQVVVLQTRKTQAELDKAQDLWRQSRVYWETTESFLFGPVESLSVDPLIDTWPLSRPDLDAILNQNAPITAEVMRTTGSNLKGFHTAEYLLFGNGVTTNKKSITALTDREIEYLLATTQVLAEDTKKLTLAWSEHSDPDDLNSLPYLTLLTKPGFDNPLYSSKESVIVQLVLGMVGIADEVGSGKIAEPLGDSIENADVAKEESPFSWNSITDFSNNINSVKIIYLGTRDGSEGDGIKKLVASLDPVLAEEVEQQIDLAIQKIKDIGADGLPFGQAIKSEAGRVRVYAAQLEVNNLHTLLSQKVLPLVRNL